MNFQNMEYFLAAAEAGNITRAAGDLKISQQALSNTIARMEAELGCRLFERHQGLELTYAGRQYKEAVTRILDIRDQTRSMLDDISGSIRGELKIGSSYTRGQTILPLVLPAFVEKYPLVEVSLTEGSTKELDSRLAHGDIDVMIGFTPFNFPDAEYHELMKERLYLVFPKELLKARYGSEEKALAALDSFETDHDIGRFADLPFVLLREGDRLRTIADRSFAAAGIKPKIKFETKNTQTAVALSAEGMGITICPELFLNSNYAASGPDSSYIRKKIEVRPMFDESSSDTIAIAYNRDRYLSHVASEFIRMTIEAVQALSLAGGS